MSSNTNTKTIEGLRGWQTEMPDHRRKHLDFLMKQWNFTPSNEGNIGDTCYVVRGSLGDSGGDVFFRSNDSREASYSQWGAAAMYLWSLQGAAPEIVAADPTNMNNYILENAGRKNTLTEQALDVMVEKVLELSNKIHIPSKKIYLGLNHMLPALLQGIYNSLPAVVRLMPSQYEALYDNLNRCYARTSGDSEYEALIATAVGNMENSEVDGFTKSGIFLLHGDLRSKNIMENNNGLSVIDPVVCYGSKEYDLATWAVSLDTESSIQRVLGELARQDRELDLLALEHFAHYACVSMMKPERYEQERRTQDRIVEYLLLEGKRRVTMIPLPRMRQLITRLYPKSDKVR